MDWMAQVLGLPTTFLAQQPDGTVGLGGGVIQGTASEACLVALLAARSRIMVGRPPGDASHLVAYTSDQVMEMPHVPLSNKP